MKWELSKEQIQLARTIKLTKVESGRYRCHPTWSYKGHIIQQDDSNFGGPLQVYCEDLFDSKSFDTIIELKWAIYKKENI